MKITSRPSVGTNKLPSRFQIGDYVIVFEDAPCVILGVHFLKHKVLYDVEDSHGVIRGRAVDVDSTQFRAACGISKSPPGWHCSQIEGHSGPCVQFENAP